MLAIIICLPACMTATSHSYSRFQLGNGPLIETKIGHGPPRSSKSKNLTKRKIIPMVMMKKDLQNLQVDEGIDGSTIDASPSSESTTTKKIFLPLRPTYKPNPEPFKPSPKLYNLRI